VLEDGGTLTGVIELQTGSDFACARVATGDVYCWGANNLGQLGDPDASGLYADRVPLP
jgi:alpha-tubulin suppressor-like RCC1 family protein